MKPVRLHRPGLPATDEPPAQLVALAGRLSDPLVTQCAITTTRDGAWALCVTVPADATVPIANVERDAAGFPVIYQAALDAPVVAWPARPRSRRK